MSDEKDKCTRRNPDPNAKVHNEVHLNGMKIIDERGNSRIVFEFACLNCGIIATSAAEVNIKPGT